jgi:hypothetical protein
MILSAELESTLQDILTNHKIHIEKSLESPESRKRDRLPDFIRVLARDAQVLQRHFQEYEYSIPHDRHVAVSP